MDCRDLTFQNVRGARQAGFKLPPEQRINNGVAPARYPKRRGAVFTSRRQTKPTHFLQGERQPIKVAGLELERFRHLAKQTMHCSFGTRPEKPCSPETTFTDRFQTYTQLGHSQSQCSSMVEKPHQDD